MDSRQTNRKIVKDFPLSNETKTVISLSLSFMEIYALIKREKATQMWLSAVSPMCVENWTEETPSTTTRNRNNKDHYFIASWQRMMRGFPPLHALSWKLYWKSCIRVETKSMFRIRALCIEICKWYATSSKCVCAFSAQRSFDSFARTAESLPTKYAVTVLRIIFTFHFSPLLSRLAKHGTWTVCCHKLHNNSMLAACLIYIHIHHVFRYYLSVSFAIHL